MNSDKTSKRRNAQIDLKPLVPFAQGANRYCFQHPENKDRCLKVIRPENIKARYNRQSPLKRLLGKARLNDNSQELKAHMQPAIRPADPGRKRINSLGSPAQILRQH